MKIIKNNQFKNVTMNRFPSKIPESWDLKKIKDISICLDNKRKPLNSAQRSKIQGEYPYWGSSNIVDYIDSYLIDENVILLGEDAAPFFDRTRPVAHLSSGKIWPNNHIHVLKSSENNYFLKSYLNYIDYNKIISIKVRPKLTKSMMDNIEIAIPSLEQQDKISNVLLMQETQVENIKELIKKLEKRNQYYAEKIISGELRIKKKDSSNLKLYSNTEWEDKSLKNVFSTKEYRIPQGWKIEKLLDNVKLLKGTSINSSKFNYQGIGYQFLRTGDVWEDASSKKEPAYFDGTVDDKFIKKEDDYLSCFEGFNKEIGDGTIGLVTNIGEGIISSHLYKTENKKVEGKYYGVSLIKTDYVQNILIRNAVGSTVLSSTKCLKDIMFIFPDRNEMNLIEEFLSPLYLEVNNLRKLLKKEQLRFQWLLDNLLSGEYKVVEE